MSTALNGFQLEFSSQTFDAYVSPFPDPEQLRDLRRQEAGQWFLHWREGVLYAIPEVAEPERTYGTKQTLSITDHIHLGFLARRINDRLPEKFPQYQALSRRPFEFLGQRDELVAKVIGDGPSPHPLINRFKIRPRFELDARIYELRDGEVNVGLFLSISTKWEIIASILELADAGIDVRGLNAVRRTPAVDERKLVGRISHIAGGRIFFSDSFDDLESINEQEVYLEGSRHSFKRCLNILLRGKYGAFDKQRGIAEGELLSGPGIEKLCQKMGEVLIKNSPIPITQQIECRVIKQITPENRDGYKTVVDAAQVDYCFDPAKRKRERYAWPGLNKFGPYSRDTFPKKSPKILVVSPDTSVARVREFVAMLSQGITSIANSRYTGGFAKLFHLHNPEFKTLVVPMLGSTSSEARARYVEAIESELGKETGYDAALVAILDEHSDLDPPLNPYLHAKHPADPGHDLRRAENNGDAQNGRDTPAPGNPVGHRHRAQHHHQDHRDRRHPREDIRLEGICAGHEGRGLRTSHIRHEENDSGRQDDNRQILPP